VKFHVIVSKNSWIKTKKILPVLSTSFVTLRASCGAVYCNRSCLWVGVFVCG